MDLIANAYTCTQIKEKQNKTLIKKDGTFFKNTQRGSRIHFYSYRIFELFLYTFHSLFLLLFFWCYAATQLARQLHQIRSQVVCNNDIFDIFLVLNPNS